MNFFLKKFFKFKTRKAFLSNEKNYTYRDILRIIKKRNFK